MALVMTPIYTQTVGAGGAAKFQFNNIPQVYTDLKIVASTRWNVAQVYTPLGMYFNNGTFPDPLASLTTLVGSGAVAASGRSASPVYVWAGYGNGTTATANTFGSVEIYIANYAGSNFKQIIADGVSESNISSGIELGMIANLWRSTSAITAIEISTGFTALQHSTVTLYGIIRSGA